MRKFSLWLASAATAAFATLAQTAQAQATRTWVSGVGDDVNPCSRTAPCKTFAGAISKTAAGGEINAIDSGGFGGVTITKSITISGDATTAGVLVSGTNGILINAASTDAIQLRNLVIDGLSNGTSLSGVNVLSAQTVFLENLQIFGFATGVTLGGAAALNVAIDSVKIRDTAGVGLLVNGTVTSNIKVAATGLHIQSAGKGVSVIGPGAASVDLSRSAIHFCSAVGIETSLATSIVRLSDTSVTGNFVGLSPSTGQIISYNNNRLRGNTTDGAPSSTVYLR